jgi:hypothetical protein
MRKKMRHDESPAHKYDRDYCDYDVSALRTGQDISEGWKVTHIAWGLGEGIAVPAALLSVKR